MENEAVECGGQESPEAPDPGIFDEYMQCNSHLTVRLTSQGPGTGTSCSGSRP